MLTPEQALYGELLLVVAAFVAALARGVGIPFLIALAVGGIAESDVLPRSLHIELSPPILGLFLPALIFEAAWNIDRRALLRATLPIVALAVPGTLVTAAFVGGAALLAGVPALPAFVLGAIVGATDPVAVLALFRQLGLPAGLRTIVEGESIVNDGVAAELAGALIAGAVGGSVAYGALGVAGSMLLEAAGGILAGVAVAFPAGFLLQRTRGAWVGSVVTLVAAYGSYALAGEFRCSGIFASAAAGVGARLFASPGLDEGARHDAIERFWEIVAFIANAAVFYLIGLSLKLSDVLDVPGVIVLTLIATFASRALLSYALLPARWLAGGRPWRHAIALSGMRGGLSLALALGLPAAMPARTAVVDATFVIVFVTLIVQGTILPPILRRLKLRPKAIETAA